MHVLWCVVECLLMCKFLILTVWRSLREVCVLTTLCDPLSGQIRSVPCSHLLFLTRPHMSNSGLRIRVTLLFRFYLCGLAKCILDSFVYSPNYIHGSIEKERPHKIIVLISGVTLVLQFLAMLWHRWATLRHIMSVTDLSVASSCMKTVDHVAEAEDIARELQRDHPAEETIAKRRQLSLRQR